MNKGKNTMERIFDKQLNTCMKKKAKKTIDR